MSQYHNLAKVSMATDLYPLTVHLMLTDEGVPSSDDGPLKVFIL